jgi:hypothetical protein
MTIGQLIEQLNLIVAKDPYHRDMTVTFGPELEPVAGGLVGKHDGLVMLNLAPVSLDQVGGF